MRKYLNKNSVESRTIIEHHCFFWCVCVSLYVAQNEIECEISSHWNLHILSILSGERQNERIRQGYLYSLVHVKCIVDSIFGTAYMNADIRLKVMRLHTHGTRQA